MNPTESFLCRDNNTSEYAWSGSTITGATSKKTELVFFFAQVSRVIAKAAERGRAKGTHGTPEGGQGLGRTLRLQEGTPAVHCVLFPFQTQLTMLGPSSWSSAEHWNVTTVPTSVPLP